MKWKEFVARIVDINNQMKDKNIREKRKLPAWMMEAVRRPPTKTPKSNDTAFL